MSYTIFSKIKFVVFKMNAKLIVKARALILIVMLVLSTVSLDLQAQDLKVTGQVRHRSERINKDFSDQPASFGFSFLRTRLNMKFTNEKNHSG